MLRVASAGYLPCGFDVTQYGGITARRIPPPAAASVKLFVCLQLMANEPLEKLGFKDLINEKSEEKPEKL
ncbi:hypothetical protein DUI87_05342 [Hirundo rustica rustica]|uniref:Uncharacterized protein n=1 Tax=Hirundo rustica rustica TaxID=333673 RepID=A0A3M0KWR6_HIRRU|nr:hypothetical protein DUI87_05342 [Hirundo rustica rustica]